MKRRIIRQGHNTLTITIPIKWARKFGLQPGSEIDLEEKENGLMISAKRLEKPLSTTIEITDMDIPTIWKYFMSVYREGYNEVIVKFASNTTLENMYKFFTRHALDSKYGKENAKRRVHERLQAMMSRFIGFEIIEHGQNFCIIREMGEATEKEFDSSLRRIFLLIQQMAEETEEATKTDDYTILDHMHDVDINVDKFSDYCIRVLNKISFKEQRKISLLFSTIFLLELLGDEFKHAANDILKMKSRSLKNLVPMSELTRTQIDKYYELFYKFNLENVKKISDYDKKMHKAETMPKMYKIATEDEKEVFTHLRRISRYIAALVELRIEMEF